MNNHVISSSHFSRLKSHIRRISILLLIFPICGLCLAGCGWIRLASQTTTALDQLPDIIPALSSDSQDPVLHPRLIWVKSDNRFAAWGTNVTKDGWFAGGQLYSGSDGQAGRLEYYDQEGLLKWFYQRSLTQYDSCYLYAALRPDGSIIAGGRITEDGKPEAGLLTALDPDGHLLWEKQIKYLEDPNIGLSITQCLITDDGQILVVAYSTQYYISIYEGRQPTILACFDQDGTQLWQTETDFSGMSYSQAAALSDNGGLYLALDGYSTSGDQQSKPFSWLLEFDPDGRELWRKNLIDERYSYEIQDMVRDQDGNLLLSCRARYLGTVPDPPAQTSVFHDRYKYYSYNPAALIKMDKNGALIWQHFLNGEFGASGQDLVCDSGNIYWKVRLTDDIVKPYIFMSMDHRSLDHEVIAVLDATGEKIRYHQFSREDSNMQLIQRVEDGQPVLIGWLPIKEDPSWTETLPEETSGQSDTSETPPPTDPVKTDPAKS